MKGKEDQCWPGARIKHRMKTNWLKMYDKFGLIRDAATGRDRFTLRGHGTMVKPNIGGVAFSPDGLRLATSCQDKTVVVWDLANGKPVHTLRGHTMCVLKVAYSTDGRQIASASDDRTVRVWDAATGWSLLTLQGHIRETIAVAYSPDSRRLPMGANDSTVKIWDTASGQELLTLRGHPQRVFAVAFSPDGKHLASGGDDGSVRLWEAAPLTPELRLRREAGRLVNRLADKLLLKADLLDHLRREGGVSDALRKQSLALAERYREDPVRFHDACWAVVWKPGAEAAQYGLALRHAEAACRFNTGQKSTSTCVPSPSTASASTKRPWTT